MFASKGDTSGNPDQAARALARAAWIRALDAVSVLRDAPVVTLPAMLPGLADTWGARPALLYRHEQLTYSLLAARANQYARWARANGLGQGDVVSLLMPNCPNHVASWLGLTRAGCVVALINTNLDSDALLHSIQIAGSRHLLVAESLLPSITSLAEKLPLQAQIVRADDPTIIEYSPLPLCPTECPLPQQRDRALLIYTSGTTGLPKAANLTHGRIAEWSLWFAGMMNVVPQDRLYNCLPMYHSIGGVVAIGAMLVKGGSVLIRDRFSVSQFWDDVVDGDCTIFQYIGELCRHLLRAPPHPKQRAHRLRLICGNGLHSEVWQPFKQRFGIPQILEFYAATEGVVSLYNAEGRPGAIGRIPPFLAHRFPIALIRCDPDTGEPLRENDLCVACPPDVAGEAIGRLQTGDAAASRQFDGYTDNAASRGKLLRDVFAKGDSWFRTGDLLRKDAAGFFYFVDRLGDTFRWRGENVSTSEVASVMRTLAGVTGAIVYGVTVPHNEGRAGMAAITINDHFDFDRLKSHLDAHLPTYAQPLFIRCCRSLDFTATFKAIKGRFVRDGFANSPEPVWFNDRGSGRFVRCDKALLESINDETRRL